MSEQLKEPFLRPNLTNKGTLPDGKEPVAECPDIWCAGNTPIFDFQNTLASEEYYQSASETKYISGYNNYFYLRVKNGSDKEINDLSAQIFYAPSSIICWPSEWKAMPVENHAEGDTVNTFDKIPSQAVGVAKAPFIMPRSLSQDVNYCYIARVYSDEYPNPVPSQLSPIYIASMLTKHMFWGQKNIASVPVEDAPQISITINVSVPAESLGTGNMWLLALYTEEAEKLQVEVRNSRTDDNGKQIVLSKQNAEEDMFIGRFRLDKGYSSQLSVYVYLPEGYVATEKEKFILNMGYIVNGEEYKQATDLDALNETFKTMALRELRTNGEATDNIEGVVRVGSYTVQLKAKK